MIANLTNDEGKKEFYKNLLDMCEGGSESLKEAIVDEMMEQGPMVLPIIAEMSERKAAVKLDLFDLNFLAVILDSIDRKKMVDIVAEENAVEVPKDELEKNLKKAVKRIRKRVEKARGKLIGQTDEILQEWYEKAENGDPLAILLNLAQ